jgi:hypothetical protein
MSRCIKVLLTTGALVLAGLAGAVDATVRSAGKSMDEAELDESRSLRSFREMIDPSPKTRTTMSRKRGRGRPQALLAHRLSYSPSSSRTADK